MTKKKFILMTLMMVMIAQGYLSHLRRIQHLGDLRSIMLQQEEKSMTNLLPVYRKMFRQQDGNRVSTLCVPPLEDRHIVRK